ncbi:23S rRNA pseudouridine synthase F, partial [Candidatus Kaiserbacteria bacterium]|nr:23S rRNA pseudouridine synthase F [Candidatus Kaiserbacteria bacterium]
MEFPMRINKYVAARGFASRREADTLIAAKQVLINGVPAEIGQQVTADDVVELKSKTKAKSYFAYYKGRGVITHSPSEGEVDIAGRLARDYG